MKPRTYYVIERFARNRELNILQFSSSGEADSYMRKANENCSLYGVSICARERMSARALRDLLVDELTYAQCGEFQRLDFRYRSLSELIMMYNYYKYNGYFDFAEEV